MVQLGRNACHRSEIAPECRRGIRTAPVTARPSSKKASKKRPTSKPTKPQPVGSCLSPRTKRLHSDETKLSIFRAYVQWLIAGRKYADSPITALMTKYRVNSDYPKRLYDRVNNTGSITRLDRQSSRRNFGSAWWSRSENGATSSKQRPPLGCGPI